MSSKRKKFTSERRQVCDRFKILFIDGCLKHHKGKHTDYKTALRVVIVNVIEVANL